MSENKQKKRGLELHREMLEEAKKTQAIVEAREARDPEYKAMRKKRLEAMDKFIPDHFSDE